MFVKQYMPLRAQNELNIQGNFEHIIDAPIQSLNDLVASVDYSVIDGELLIRLANNEQIELDMKFQEVQRLYKLWIDGDIEEFVISLLDCADFRYVVLELELSAFEESFIEITQFSYYELEWFEDAGIVYVKLILLPKSIIKPNTVYLFQETTYFDKIRASVFYFRNDKLDDDWKDYYF